MRPGQDEYAAFYHKYVQLVPDGAIHETLSSQQIEFESMLSGVSLEREEFCYADGKWSVKQVVQHVIDTERVFAYRMLAFSRGDQTSLPGFDENAYAAAAPLSHRSLSALRLEFEAVRKSTHSLVDSLTPDQFIMRGKASDSPVSVRGLAFIIAGHCAHHMKILRERYAV